MAIAVTISLASIRCRFASYAFACSVSKYALSAFASSFVPDTLSAEGFHQLGSQLLFVDSSFAIPSTVIRK